MVYRKIVFFDQPLESVHRQHASAAIPEDEVNRRIEEAFRQGAEKERLAARKEIDALRAEMSALSAGALGKIINLEEILTRQIQQALPSLALEIADRMLAGFQPPVEAIDRLCKEALEQLYPEREGLELSLCPRDLELLQSLNPEWLKRYSGLRLVADNELVPGDCVVRSRFGLTDARQKTKLASLSRSLAGT